MQNQKRRLQPVGDAGVVKADGQEERGQRTEEHEPGRIDQLFPGNRVDTDAEDHPEVRVVCRSVEESAQRQREGGEADASR